MAKALVTGCAGFIGSHLAEDLLRRSYDVVGIDCLTDYYDPATKRRNLANQNSDNRFRFVDEPLQRTDLVNLLRDVDVVFHQAGQPGVRASWGRSFTDYVGNNIDATQQLLEAVLNSNRGIKMVYASSSSVYGDAEAYPTTESTVPCPRSPYGVTKLAAEHLCSLYASNYGVETVSLRYFTVYGPRQRPDMAFTRFVRAIVRGDEINVYGDGLQVRDFTYVDDIVAANVAAAEAPVAPGSVYNIAGGSNTRLRDAIETLERISGKGANISYKSTVAGDVKRTCGDTTKAAKELGWKPMVSLEDGLAQHYAWGQKEFAASV